jgi:hypothetical protein
MCTAVQVDVMGSSKGLKASRQRNYLEAGLALVCVVAFVLISLASFTDTYLSSAHTHAGEFEMQALPLPRRSMRGAATAAKGSSGNAAAAVEAEEPGYLAPPLPSGVQTVLILTPVKDFSPKHSKRYIALVRNLTYPHAAISIAMLESDSQAENRAVPDELGRVLRSQREWNSVRIFHHNFKYELGQDSVYRHASSVQQKRRAILAQSRNQLLMRAIGAHDWVLWLDSDLAALPHDVLEDLISVDKDIVVPDCQFRFEPRSYDLNSYKEMPEYHEWKRRKGDTLKDDDLLVMGYYNSPQGRRSVWKLKVRPPRLRALGASARGGWARARGTRVPLPLPPSPSSSPSSSPSPSPSLCLRPRTRARRSRWTATRPREPKQRR